jgi:membrane associated rhomboid family serine protease
MDVRSRPLRPTGLAALRPWADGSGRRWRGLRRLPLAAPFCLLYLALSWALFLPQARWNESDYVIDVVRMHDLLFFIPDLRDQPIGVLESLVTAPFLNHNRIQLVYVTVLLLVFGLVFEAREGSGRTMLIFFGCTYAAALIAGLLHLALYPQLLDTALLKAAGERTYSGGSAGCFGLLGAIAARARFPWLVLGLVVGWEMAVWLGYLRNYTPAFHLTALILGFLAMRYLVMRRDRPPVAVP